MVPAEFSALLKEMQALFPAANICPDNESKTAWYRVLGDLEYRQVEAAILRHACTSKFPPSASEIRCQAAQVSAPEKRDWLEGWADVQRAMHRWGMHRPAEALAALEERDPLTAKVTAMLGWQALCLSENPTADRANFRESYERFQSRKAEYDLLPPAIRPTIGSLADAFRLTEGRTGEEFTKAAGMLDMGKSRQNGRGELASGIEPGSGA